MHQKTYHKQKSNPWIYLNIYVILKTTDSGVISASEPRRWKTLNNYEFYQQVLSVHEWSHSQAWMGLCVTLVRSEASLKIQVNSPMRLSLKIRHGDKQTWPRYEPVLQIPCRMIVCTGTIERTSQRLKNSLFISCRSLDESSLAVPNSPLSGNRPFTDRTFTNDLITVLA